MVVLCAYAALTGKRDQGETVEAFTYLNATHLAIAAFRAFKGSSASLKNCAIFGRCCSSTGGRRSSEREK